MSVARLTHLKSIYFCPAFVSLTSCCAYTPSLREKKTWCRPHSSSEDLASRHKKNQPRSGLSEISGAVEKVLKNWQRTSPSSLQFDLHSRRQREASMHRCSNATPFDVSLLTFPCSWKSLSWWWSSKISCLTCSWPSSPPHNSKITAAWMQDEGWHVDMWNLVFTSVIFELTDILSFAGLFPERIIRMPRSTRRCDVDKRWVNHVTILNWSSATLSQLQGGIIWPSIFNVWKYNRYHFLDRSVTHDWIRAHQKYKKNPFPP